MGAVLYDITSICSPSNHLSKDDGTVIALAIDRSNAVLLVDVFFPQVRILNPRNYVECRVPIHSSTDRPTASEDANHIEALHTA